MACRAPESAARRMRPDGLIGRRQACRRRPSQPPCPQRLPAGTECPRPPAPVRGVDCGRRGGEPVDETLSETAERCNRTTSKRKQHHTEGMLPTILNGLRRSIYRTVRRRMHRRLNLVSQTLPAHCTSRHCTCGQQAKSDRCVPRACEERRTRYTGATPRPGRDAWRLQDVMQQPLVVAALHRDRMDQYDDDCS